MPIITLYNHPPNLGKPDRVVCPEVFILGFQYLSACGITYHPPVKKGTPIKKGTAKELHREFGSSQESVGSHIRFGECEKFSSQVYKDPRVKGKYSEAMFSRYRGFEAPPRNTKKDSLLAGLQEQLFQILPTTPR